MKLSEAKERIFCFLTDNYANIDYKDRIAMLISITALEDKIKREKESEVK